MANNNMSFAKTAISASTQAYADNSAIVCIVQQSDIDSGAAVVDNGIAIHWDEMGDGARPERVLQLVLSRIETLHTALPCGENEHILQHLKEALRWEEVRNERRRAQGVQGTWQPHREEGVDT